MIELRVEKILRKSKLARKDDYILYAIYIDAYHPNLKYVTLYDVLKNHNHYKLPSFKSIFRARQKLQAKYSELKGESIRIK